MSQALHELTLKEALSLSSQEKNNLISALNERSQKLNPQLNAFLRFTPYTAKNENVSGPLAGIPIALKDNICVQGKEITCGSKILKGHIPPYDATCNSKSSSLK